jgi:hypothetical protein
VPIRQGFAPNSLVTTFDGSGAPVTAPANALAPAPVNALAPAAAPAPVNALAPQANVDVMRRKRDQLLAMGTTQSIAAARAMDADIALASNAPPEVKLLRALNLPITEDNIKRLEMLKKSPSDFESLLAGTNLSDAEKTALRVKKALKETTHAPGATVVLPAQEKAFEKMYM